MSEVKPRITVVTLGVEDLDRAVAFCRDGLGLPIDGIVGEVVALFTDACR